MAESKICDGNFIVIQSFMVKKLKLKGLELLIYAIIYGFSQGNQGVFNGSLRYLSDWTNSTKRGVMKALESLIEKGLISKDEIWKNEVKFCAYQCTEFTTPLNKVPHPMELNSPPPMELSSPNNILIDNIIDNKEDNKEPFCYSTDFELNNMIIKFIEYRKSIRKPMTKYAISLLIRELDTLSSSNDDKVKILETSILNGWSGIFPLKSNDTNSMIKQGKGKQSINDLSAMLTKIQGDYK